MMAETITLQLKNGTFVSKIPPSCYPDKISSNGIFHEDLPLDFPLPMLLLQLTMVVIVTNIVKIILKPLDLPSSISYLIGGLLVGPSGFGHSKTFLVMTFPERSIDVLNFTTTIGMIYYLFIIGVKQDPKVIVNSGRKALGIAFVSAIIPFTLLASFFLVATVVSRSSGHIKFYVYLTTSLSLSAFANLIPILTELQLLNSNIGRLAISTSTNHNVAIWLVYLIIGVLRNNSTPYKALCYVASIITVMIFLFCIFRPMLFSIIKRTPYGRPVDNSYIIAILLSVLVISFVTNIIGDTPTMGALFLGLAVPEGPPLGATLVQKSETIVQCFFLPLLYATIGLKADVFAIRDWTTWRNLQFLIILGYIAKMLGTMLPSNYFKISFRDALSLAFILNFKDLLELIAYMKIFEHKIIDEQTYTSLVLFVVVMNTIATPIVRRLNQHTKLYMPYGLRTIEHTKPNTELRMVTCVHSKEDVPLIIKLLDVSSKTSESPLFVWNFNLMDIEGRAAPMLISHISNNNSSFSMNPHIKEINDAFHQCLQRNGRWLSMQSFTSVSPCKTMYHDVCKLALDKKASIIIMPFYKMMDGVADNTLRILNSNILSEAPCSVGIMVDCNNQSNSLLTNSFYHICVIFLGGADDHEALSYGIRIADHPFVRLDVVRILSEDEDVAQRQLDNELIAMFKVKCASNERVAYREEMVYDCKDTITILRSMKGAYDLMVVGRQQKRKLLSIHGLSQWCENPELGVIGDLLSSADFCKGMGCVMVVQQQINFRLAVPNAHDKVVSKAKTGFTMNLQ